MIGAFAFSARRYRYVKNAERHGGVKCPRTMEKHVPCNTDKCPIDGVWAQWSGWTRCDKSCGPGVQKRRRYEEVTTAFGGVPVQGPSEQERDCEEMPCPIHCEWSRQERTQHGRVEEGSARRYFGVSTTLALCSG